MYTVVVYQQSQLVAETEDRRMMVLSAVISDEDRAQLVSDWGRVEGKADFDALMLKMERMAALHHTLLPRRLDQS